MKRWLKKSLILASALAVVLAGSAAAQTDYSGYTADSTPLIDATFEGALVGALSNNQVPDKWGVGSFYIDDKGPGMEIAEAGAPYGKVYKTKAIAGWASQRARFGPGSGTNFTDMNSGVYRLQFDFRMSGNQASYHDICRWHDQRANTSTFWSGYFLSNGDVIFDYKKNEVTSGSVDTTFYAFQKKTEVPAVFDTWYSVTAYFNYDTKTVAVYLNGTFLAEESVQLPNIDWFSPGVVVIDGTDPAFLEIDNFKLERMYPPLAVTGTAITSASGMEVAQSMVPSTGAKIGIAFNNALNTDEANFSGLTLCSASDSTEAVPVTAAYDGDTKTLTVAISGTLVPDADYVLTLQNMQDTYGSTLEEHVISFTACGTGLAAGKPVITGENGRHITYLVQNDTDESKTVALLVGVYSEDAQLLQGVSYQSITLEPHTKNTMDGLDIRAEDMADGNRVTAYVFDGLDTLRPLRGKYSVQ